MSTPPPDATPNAKQSAKGFAVPPKLHVGVLFMIQFMVLIMFFGMTVPEYHTKGVSTPVLVIASVGVLIVLQLLLSMIGKLLPVRCKQCRSQSRFLGFGWWPFIYRYGCGQCGQQMKYEVGAR